MMDAAKVLGINPDATAEEIRAAYVRKVREHPPDRSPEEFERIRDAYNSLRDPRQRMRDSLLSADAYASLVSVIGPEKPQRRFVGIRPWLEALKTK